MDILRRLSEPKVHNLDFEDLEMVCFKLTSVSSFEAHIEVVINNEHFKFWSWMGQIVSASDGNPHHEYFTSDEFQLKELLYLTIRCALVTGKKIDSNILTLDQYEMASGSFRSVSYLSFPLLEGMLRKACNEYVDYSGKVKKQFTITYTDGRSSKTYYQNRYPSRCNSIEDMLYLYQNEIIDDSTKLDDLLQDVQQLSSNGEHAFKTIYNWRNSTLHGDKDPFVIIGGIVLNISLFILLNSIKDKYITYRDRALRSADKTESRLLFYKPNSYYEVSVTTGQRKKIQKNDSNNETQ